MSVSGNMENIMIYLAAEESSVCQSPIVTVEAIGTVYCRDEKITAHLEKLPVLNFDEEEKKKTVLPVITVIQKMEEALASWFPGKHIYIENIGAVDLVVVCKPPEKQKTSPVTLLFKGAFVGSVTFLGAAFTIATYNEDVGVTGVFEKVYQTVLGTVPSQPGILEMAYAIGVAAGLIIFFHHFGQKKISDEPTPIEIEMEKYTKDLDDTFIKVSGRSRHRR